MIRRLVKETIGAARFVDGQRVGDQRCQRQRGQHLPGDVEATCFGPAAAPRRIDRADLTADEANTAAMEGAAAIERG